MARTYLRELFVGAFEPVDALLDEDVDLGLFSRAGQVHTAEESCVLLDSLLTAGRREMRAPHGVVISYCVWRNTLLYSRVMTTTSNK